MERRLEWGLHLKFSLSHVLSLIDDLRTGFPDLRVEYFKAKLPILLSNNLPRKRKKSAPAQANDVEIMINGNVVIRMFGSRFRAGGIFFDENLSEDVALRILCILNRNGIYTREQTMNFAFSK
jgi:hypothetical protein